MTQFIEQNAAAAPVKSKQFIVTLLMLSLPVAGQMLLQSFLGMADVMMVAPLGEQAIAAVGLAAKIHFLLLVLMSGFAAGASVLIAQYSGAKDFLNCQRTLAVTLVMGMVIMIPIMFACGFAAPFWIHWINPDPQVANLSAQFLVITAPVIVLTQLIVIYEASLRALGETSMPLMAGVTAAVINVALNYLLITGNWGFPVLGIAGAAWATLTARIVQLAVIFLFIYGKQHGFALSAKQCLQGLDRQHISQYLAFALPLVSNYGIWAVGNATYHIVTGFAGTDALAVMGMIVPIESTFFALFVGLGNACAVLIGRSLGANQMDEAWRLKNFFVGLTIVLLITLISGLWFARPWITHFFEPLPPTTAELLLQTLSVYCLLVWLKAINFMRIIGVLRAGGDNKFCLITDTLVMWAFGLPIYILAVFFGHFPFYILYALMFVDDALKFIPVWWRVIRKKWMNNLTLQHE